MTKLASDLTHLLRPDTQHRDKGAEQSQLSEGFSCQWAKHALAGAFLSKLQVYSMALGSPKSREHPQTTFPAYLPPF